MSQIIRQYAGKEIKLFSELFTNKNSEDTFVSLFMHKSILVNYEEVFRKYIWFNVQIKMAIQLGSSEGLKIQGCQYILIRWA